jgi:hypothetical protein
MKIFTSLSSTDEGFASEIMQFSDWCESALFVTAFFNYEQLLKILNNDGKKVCLVVSLRPPTSYYSLLVVSALKHVEVRFLKKELHSKIYSFTKNNSYKAAVGSSNLTNGGLFNNIETNVVFEGDDAYECYKTCSDIKGKSFQLTPRVLSEYKSIYDSFVENKGDEKEVNTSSTTEDEDYNKLWSAVDLVASFVETELNIYFKDIPPYLVIDHFWHYIVQIKKDEHKEITANMKRANKDQYLTNLFNDFIGWDAEVADGTKEIHQRSVRMKEIFSTNTQLNEQEILEVFLTLHSTRGRDQRFNHGKQFLEKNTKMRINNGFRHLLDETIDLNKRVEDLLSPEFELKLFKESAVREFNGWHYPEQYPIRNLKADSALKILSLC